MRKGKVLLWMLCCVLAINNIFIMTTYGEQTAGGMRLTYDGKEHYYTAEPTSLIVNGNLIDTTMPPIILEGRALVPAREVFGPLGAVVDWKPDTREIFVGMNDTLIILQIDNKVSWINGIAHELDMPPKIITSTESKTMIPARFVAETLGLQVNWDKENRRVEIDQPKPETIIPEVPQENNEIEFPIQEGNMLTWQPEGVQIPQQELLDVNIKPQSSETIDIVNVIVPTQPTAEQVFTIQASGVISDVKPMILEDNRLVVDIINANWKLNSTIAVQNQSVVKSIRSSQNQMNPEKITRVVFDLNAAYPTSISLTPDRKSILVQIQKNNIYRVQVEKNQLGEQIHITGSYTPIVDITKMSLPERLVIDLQNASSFLNTREADISGTYISKVRTSQFNSSTMRVVLELRRGADYHAVLNGNTISIQLFEPNQTIQYINQQLPQFIIQKDPKYPISAAQIMHEDLYMNNMYRLTLPGDYSSLYGQRIMQIGDSQLESVAIQNNSKNQTELIFMQKRIFVYDIAEDANNIYIQLVSPKQKYKQVVVVDAGHGGKDPGAQANGLVEKTLNLDISLRLQQLLENDPNIKVYMTRATDVFIELADRAKIANEIGADLFISIHNNSYTAATKGTETYYANLATKKEPSVTSRQAAQIFQDNLVKRLGTVDRKIRENNQFAVLRLTTMPAVLLEIGYMTNTEDARQLASSEFRQRAADAIYESIQQIFERYPIIR